MMGIDEEIKNKISQSITISRLPKKAKDLFIKFANKDFCGDYGMTLKHLVDSYFGIINFGIEHLEQEIMLLREELKNVKNSLSNKKGENSRTTLSGKRIGE